MDKIFLKFSLAILLVVLGLFLRKAKILKDDFIHRLTRLTTDFFFPCLVFYSVYTGFRIELMSSMYILFLLALGISFLCYLTALGVSSFLHMEESTRKVFLLMSFKPATGFIGIPLVLILFGKQGLILAGPYAFGIGLAFYTLGLWILRGRKFSLYTMFHPISATIIVSLLLVLLKIHIPLTLLKPIKFLGLFAVPFSLGLVGWLFGQLDSTSGLFDKKMILTAFNKLMLAPVLAFIVCTLLSTDLLTRRVAVLMAALPSSFTAPMWALRFNADCKWASSSALLTGILSIPTIIFFLYIIR